MRLMTQTLVGWLEGFGIARGGPTRQPGSPGYSGFETPAELQWRFGWGLPGRSAVPVGEMVKLPAAQPVILVKVPPKPPRSSVSGTGRGSGTPTPEPPK